jgi:hypothetical protein
LTLVKRIVTHYCAGDKIGKNEMGVACGERRGEVLVAKLEGKDH